MYRYVTSLSKNCFFNLPWHKVTFHDRLEVIPERYYQAGGDEMRKPYRFTLDPVRHKDIIQFLEDFPKCERGKCVIEALRQYMTKFPPGEDVPGSRDEVQEKKIKEMFKNILG